MRKIFSVVLCAVILFTLCSCSTVGFKSNNQGLNTGNKDVDIEKIVVAEVGDIKIDGAMYAYVVYSYVNSYASYAAQYGYDSSLSLLNQTTTYTSTSGSMTWYQFFCGLAEDTINQYVALASAAKAAGMQFDADDIKTIDEDMANLKKQALQAGFGSVEKYLNAYLTPGITEGAVRRIAELETLATKYCEKFIDDLSYTYEELEQRRTSFDDYVSQNVRHILFSVDTSLTGLELEYAFTAAKQEAESVLAEYMSGEKTAERFGELAKEHTDDGNGDEGGLYENVLKGDMVEEFENWIYDEARQVGDVELVKTTYGWHIMYYEGRGMIAWQVTAEDELKEEDYNKLVEELTTKTYPVEYDYEAMFVSLGGEL